MRSSRPLPATVNVLAVVVTLGFLATIGAKLWMVVSGHPGDGGESLSILVGVLSGAEFLVLSFYFGSSVGTWVPATEVTGALGASVAVPEPTPAPLPAPAPTQGAPVTTVPPRSTLTVLPGRYKELRGKVSWFGGPDDTESGNPEEGVAIYSTGSTRPDLFLPTGPGLFRRLNTEVAMYCAARWDYHETPVSWLQTHTCTLTNPANGKSVEVWPVDWGPNVRTGRTMDVSHAAILKIGLETDQQAVLRVPLPGTAVAPTPAPRAHPTILSDARLKAAFGEFKYQEAPGGRVTIDPEWVRANIVEATVPQLAHLGVRDGRVECHRLVEAALVAGWADVERAGLLGALLTFDGLWVPRHMTWNSARPLSRHSWGIAFDVNAGFNGYNTAGAKPGTHGSLWEVAPIFEDHGFAWGERWTSAKGPMHFEYAIA